MTTAIYILLLIWLIMAITSKVLSILRHFQTRKFNRLEAEAESYLRGDRS